MTLTVTTQERRRRALDDTGAEIRADGDGGEKFVGLASPFGVRAPIGNPKTWGFFEEFQAGAFTKTLQEGDQRMLIDHDSYYVVSRVSAGTLTLSQSKRGLETQSDLDDGLSYVADLKANLRNGNITGMSIGFYVVRDRWDDVEVEEEGDDGKVRVYTAELRTVQEVRLVEVSAVTFPAFVSTEAELNSVAAALARRGDVEAVESRVAYRPELRELLDDQRFASRAPKRQAIASHSTGTSDAAWDGPANEKRLPSGDDGDAATLKKAYAWIDPDGDKDKKSAYKFIHHLVDSDGSVGDASTVACTTGIGVLNGARGGTTIPDADRKGVYNHLAKHLKDADITPPELKSADELQDVTPDDGGAQVIDSEPGESTRDDDNTAEPGESTPRHVEQIDLAMRGYAARYGLQRPA